MTSSSPRNPASDPRPAAAHELKRLTTCRLPTVDGEFEMSVWQASDDIEIILLTQGDLTAKEPLFVRIHSQCFTSEVFGSLRCDCRLQLDLAQQHIGKLGRGALIYLQQEGRGIGLANKIRAYALQDEGADTLEANHRLGFAGDLRDYSAAGELLVKLQVRCIQLHTNNPHKIAGVEAAGIKIDKVVPSLTPPNEHNARYLYTKAHRMGHETLLELDFSPFGSPENPL